MEMGRLEAFIQVATKLSFSRAAEGLYLTQPTVTARIQGLERELGEPLFERMGRTIRLTDAGQAFLPYAQRALQSVAEGRDALSSLRNVDSGSLTIGTAPTVGTYVLPGILQQLSERHPGVEVSIRTGRSEEVQAMVLADEVQVGFERYLTHPDIESVPLYEDDIALMASARHPLATRGRTTVSEVAREPVIFFDVHSSYHAISQAIFREQGVTPRHSLDVDNLEMAKHLVLRGLGLAFLPRLAVQQELAAGSLVAIEISGTEPLRRRIALIYRKRRLQSRATMALLALLDEIYRFEYANPTGGQANVGG
ncbi:MAG: DNA-binding transcriptional regulator, LysR family [Chloroflexi bacterium]|jgi:DNA-binding transcriptional LysR family regulator|nr:MAG: DNA-binding transcriptional regulator, LysR family [Chloroflexota bacterium]